MKFKGLAGKLRQAIANVHGTHQALKGCSYTESRKGGKVTRIKLWLNPTPISNELIDAIKVEFPNLISVTSSRYHSPLYYKSLIIFVKNN